MNSREYRLIIKTIVKNAVRKKFPGIKRIELDEAAQIVAKAVHARLYGATVDGVATPIWRDHDAFKQDIGDMQPTKTAQALLDDPQI